VLLVATILYFKVEYFQLALTSLEVEGDILRGSIAVPIALTGWVFLQSKSFLFPKVDAKKLVNWSGYWKLKSHLFVAISYNVLFAAACVFLLLIENIDPSARIFFFLTSYFIVVLSSASFYFADIKIREIYEKHI